MCHELYTFGTCTVFDRFIAVLDYQAAGQLGVLRQYVFCLLASVTANIHENRIFVSGGRIVVKRDCVNTVSLLRDTHKALEVLQQTRMLLEPREKTEVRVKASLDRRSRNLILISRFLQEVGQSLKGRVADSVEEAHGAFDPRIGQGVRSLPSDELIGCNLRNESISYQIAHNTTHQQRIGSLRLRQLL